MDFYKGTIPILEDKSAHRDELFPKRASFGLIPRDYDAFPQEMFSSPDEMQLINESDYDAIYDEQEALKSSLEHIYLNGPNGQPQFVNLDQNGQGYCWAYSTGHAIMVKRLGAGNQRIPRLNPHATAAIIKKGRDEGGWCGLSAQFARENGYAEEGTGPGQWPLHSMSLKYDTPELRAQMALNKVTEDWVDLRKQVYDQTLSLAQLDTCLFNNFPCPTDFNWWGHSVCMLRKVRIEKGSWGRLILNSWKDWGRFGLAVLKGKQANPDSMLSFRSITAVAA